jgi:hypothetical protein
MRFFPHTLSRISHLFLYLHQLVRESSAQRGSTQRYVSDTRSAIQELAGKIASIRARAASSEQMVDEICKGTTVSMSINLSISIYV